MNIIAKTKSKLSNITFSKENQHGKAEEETSQQQQQESFETSYESKIGQTPNIPQTRTRAFSVGRKQLQRAPPSFERYGGSLLPAGNVRDSLLSGNVPPIPSDGHKHGDYNITDFDRYRLETASTEPVHDGYSSATVGGVDRQSSDLEKRKGVTFA